MTSFFKPCSFSKLSICNKISGQFFKNLDYVIFLEETHENKSVFLKHKSNK